MVYPGHEGAGQNTKQRYSQEHRRVEGLARQPTPQSNIPLRASAHPSALPTVQPKPPRRLSNQERITDFDGLGESLYPTSPTGSGVSQRSRDDHFTAHVFRNIEDIVSIDEIDTLPLGVQARHNPRLKRAAYEPSAISEMDTLPIASVQRRQAGVSHYGKTRRWTATQLPTVIGQRTRGVTIWHGFDKVRWWLLSPGRLEFLLWLIGAIVLVSLTSLFLLIVTVSLGLFGLGGAYSR